MEFAASAKRATAPCNVEEEHRQQRARQTRSSASSSPLHHRKSSTRSTGRTSSPNSASRSTSKMSWQRSTPASMTRALQSSRQQSVRPRSIERFRKPQRYASCGPAPQCASCCSSARRRPASKWQGYIDGRPDLDETALSEEAARRKMEQLRDRIGACGATTKLFGSRTCELIAGHHEPGAKRAVPPQRKHHVVRRSPL
jgi:hypothetical protein